MLYVSRDYSVLAPEHCGGNGLFMFLRHDRGPVFHCISGQVPPRGLGTDSPLIHLNDRDVRLALRDSKNV